MLQTRRQREKGAKAIERGKRLANEDALRNFRPAPRAALASRRRRRRATLSGTPPLRGWRVSGSIRAWFLAARRWGELGLVHGTSRWCAREGRSRYALLQPGRSSDIGRFGGSDVTDRKDAEVPPEAAEGGKMRHGGEGDMIAIDIPAPRTIEGLVDEAGSPPHRVRRGKQRARTAGNQPKPEQAGGLSTRARLRRLFATARDGARFGNVP